MFDLRKSDQLYIKTQENLSKVIESMEQFKQEEGQLLINENCFEDETIETFAELVDLQIERYAEQETQISDDYYAFALRIKHKNETEFKHRYKYCKKNP